LTETRKRNGLANSACDLGAGTVASSCFRTPFGSYGSSGSGRNFSITGSVGVVLLSLSLSSALLLLSSVVCCVDESIGLSCFSILLLLLLSLFLSLFSTFSIESTRVVGCSALADKFCCSTTFSSSLSSLSLSTSSSSSSSSSSSVIELSNLDPSVVVSSSEAFSPALSAI
jgi:hypothetical protein